MPEEGAAHRPPPDDRVALQVVASDPAAAAGHGLDDRRAELALVDRPHALDGDALERLTEIGQAELVPRLEAAPVRAAVDTAALGGVAQDLIEDRVEMRLRPRERNAAAGELDRGLQQLAPRQPSVGPVNRLEACSRARNGAGGLADPEDLRRVAVAAEPDVDRVHLRTPRHRSATPGRRDEKVRHPRRPPVRGGDQGEATRPRPGQRALGYPGGERGRHAGVGGVPALFEDPRPGPRAQGVTGGDCPLHDAFRSVDEHCSTWNPLRIFTVSALTRREVSRPQT